MKGNAVARTVKNKLDICLALAVVALMNVACAEQSSFTFKDCDECPEMVSVPPLKIESETDRISGDSGDDEARSDSIQFQISVTPITFSQWDACVVDGGCSYVPSDFGWGREDQPVIDVSWNDAQEYTRWLSQRTGLQYRLPFQHEWHHAAKAETEGRFLFGHCISTDQANFSGKQPPSGCPSGEWRQRPVPVASFQPNAWGLFDVHGNVWEWQADCEKPQSRREASDSSCTRAMLKGGAWTSPGDMLALSISIQRRTYDRRDDAGFRVLRILED